MFLNNYLMNKIIMTVELSAMESFTLLCKECYGITLNDRISLNIVVLVEHA